MLNISCEKDIIQLKEKLHPDLIYITTHEFDLLFEMLGSEQEVPPFRLDDNGYGIVWLEPEEENSALRSLGLASPFYYVEYVEIYTLNVGQYYKIMIMYDNDCCRIIFSRLGTQNADLEAWLKEQTRKGMNMVR